MNQIENILSPERLLLVWRPNQVGAPRTRCVVGEITQPDTETQAVLRYLTSTPEFENARREGFEGYPAFPIEHPEHSSNVLDSFLRRLPPRKREDFTIYLQNHRLPVDGRLSDMTLLAYTNAKLPSDGFELYGDFAEANPPFELVIEVAGFRHQDGISSDEIYVGDAVSLKAEPDNPHDKQAIAVFHSGKKIGYVPRVQAPAFHSWQRRGFKINVTVERVNGKPERPLIYLFVTVR
jgi:hypothetical protein